VYTSPPAAISAAGLRKSFGDLVVLDGIDLSVEEGSVYALLGPNGAGKTTMIDILCTLSRADAGSVLVGGHDVVQDPESVRAAIAVTGQFSAVDNLLTGEENLRLMADLRHLGTQEGRRRSADLLERFDLGDAARKSVSTYSGGMRRKLDLAMGLMSNPRIVFLDEPTTGLDPRSRRTMWDIVRGLVADNVTILLTTQYLDEADQLADRIGVLDGGRLVAEGTAAELKQLVPGATLRLTFRDRPELDSAAAALPGAAASPDTLSLAVPSDGSLRSIRSVLGALDAACIDAQHLTVDTPDLDDVFLALTGHPTDDTAHDPSDEKVRIS
jgi:ABC-2 type transport system ATP-binding protein